MSDAAAVTTDTQVDDWFAGIPEPLKEAPFIKPLEDGSVRSLDQVLADLKNASQHMGNSLRIPGPDASEEDIKTFQQRAAEKIPGLMPVPTFEDEDSMNAVLQKLGKPEGPDGYSTPEGVEIDAETLGSLKAKAHQYGMTDKQFQSWVSDLSKEQIDAQARQVEALKEDVDQLRGEWGEAFGPRIERIAGLLNKTGAPEYLLNALKNNSLPSNDLKWLYAMSESLGAEGQNLYADQNDDNVISPDEALAQLNEIERNPALWNASDPDQKRLIKRRMELMRKAYPGG